MEPRLARTAGPRLFAAQVYTSTAPSHPVSVNRPSAHPAMRRRFRSGTLPFCGTAGLVLASIVAVPTALAAQDRGLGPLPAEDGAPLHRLGLTLPSERADPIPGGTVEWDVWLGLSNVFEYDSTTAHALLVDMERLVSLTQVRLGIADGLEIGARLTFETTGGGRLDGFISRWHDLLGVGNANRGLVPKGGYEQRLSRAEAGLVLDAPSRTFGLEDVRVFAKARILGSAEGAGTVSLRATGRMPMERAGLVRERPDVGATLLARSSLGAWHLHGMAGATTVRTTSTVDPGLFRRSAYHALAGVERSLGAAWSAAVHYQVSTPILAAFDHPELDGVSANLVFGVLGDIGGWRWNVSFQEDVPANTPAADFTLAAGLSRRW